ncbi:MAG: GIY-YIG nuclease family protein [Chitinophagaceae bacterium]|nr:GIY-YIG nuclease family protein [Chitinophagaceae bacterium]
MPFTYILFSEKLNKYYVGACTNIQSRLYEHNIGHSTFKKTGLPWKLVYSEEYDSLPDAKMREKQIKKMKSRKYIEDIIENGIASRL